jgi:hypothetical protein
MHENKNIQIIPPASSHDVNQNQTSADINEEKSKRKLPLPKILVAGIIILITLLAFGLIEYLLMGEQKTGDKSNAKSPVYEKQDSGKANWKSAYIGDLSFNYPEKYFGDYSCGTFKIDLNTFDTSCPARDYNSSFKFNIIGNIKLDTYKSTFESNERLTNKSSKELIIDGRDALITKANLTETGVMKNLWNLYIQDSVDLYNFSSIHLPYSEEEHLFDQIISTFKFENKFEELDTSTWKVHESDCDLYLFYPSEWTAQSEFFTNYKDTCMVIGDEDFIFGDGDAVYGFYLHIRKYALDVNSYESLESYIKSYEYSQKTYGPHSGFQFDPPGRGDNRSFVFLKDGFIYDINWPISTSGPYFKTISEIISSIEFTN